LYVDLLYIQRSSLRLRSTGQCWTLKSRKLGPPPPTWIFEQGNNINSGKGGRHTASSSSLASLLDSDFNLSRKRYRSRCVELSLRVVLHEGWILFPLDGHPLQVRQIRSLGIHRAAGWSQYDSNALLQVRQDLLADISGRIWRFWMDRTFLSSTALWESVFVEGHLAYHSPLHRTAFGLRSIFTDPHNSHLNYRSFHSSHLRRSLKQCYLQFLRSPAQVRVLLTHRDELTIAYIPRSCYLWVCFV